MAQLALRETFGYILKRLRDEHGLSQQQLAERAGYSSVYISMLERSQRSPSKVILERISESLELSDDERAQLTQALNAQRDLARDIKGSFPVPLTPLLGREKELARAIRYLTQKHVRLLTISGPAGVGKTRLSLQLAADLRGTLSDGMYFVDLAAIREPDLVFAAIASLLEIQESGKQSLLERLVARVKQQRMLWVLDNFEQVLDARTGVVTLLTSCPNLVMVVTSRAALEVRGEQTLTLSPLAVPGSQQKRIERQAQSALRRSDARLLSLIGPGKISAMRLAFQVASATRRKFPGAIYSLDCVPLTDQQLLPALAQCLGLPVADAGIENVVIRLGDQPSLLILHSLDHLHEATNLISELLACCSSLKIMVTAHAPLHLVGEQVVLVPGLASPDEEQAESLEDSLHSPAIELFCQRAQAIDPDFQLTLENAPVVIEICRRIDGLPLAIELAAARLKILSPLMLLDRLADFALPPLEGGSSDLPPRQRSLRHAIAWSYDLLMPQQRAVFRRLSVFAGGCTMADLVSFYKAIGMSSRALSESMEALIENSLVQIQEREETEPRFTLLETIREYGLEELARTGEAIAWRQGFATWLTQAIADLSPALLGAAQAESLRRVARDLDNIREALRWSITPEGDIVTGLRLAALLRRYWDAAGYLSEGRAWLRALLARMEQGEFSIPPAIVIAALFVAGFLADLQFDFIDAKRLLEASWALAEHEGDRIGGARAMMRLGIIAVDEGEPARGKDLLRQSLQLCQEAGNRREEATALQLLGYAHLRSGQSAEAERYFARSLILHEQEGDHVAIANVVNNLGEIAIDRGQFDRAQNLLSRGLAIFRQLEAPSQIAMVLNNIGMIARQKGEYVQAFSLFTEASVWRQSAGDERGAALAQANIAAALCEMGQYDQAYALAEESQATFARLQNQRGLAFVSGVLAEIACRQGFLDQAERLYRRHAEYFLAFGHVRDQLSDLVGFAHIAAARHHDVEALRLYAAVKAALERESLVLPHAAHIILGADLSELRERMSDTEYERAWREGAALSVLEALALCLTS